MMTSSLRLLGLISLLALMLGMGSGCGKKNWPEPVVDKDRFVWSEMSAQVEGKCLQITALLSGNVQNLGGLTLEVEMRSDPCPGCPFAPTIKERMAPGSEDWKRRGALVYVNWCGLEPDKAIRWRLIGHPLHASLADVPSRVYILDADGQEY